MGKKAKRKKRKRGTVLDVGGGCIYVYFVHMNNVQMRMCHHLMLLNRLSCSGAAAMMELEDGLSVRDEGFAELSWLPDTRF